MHSCVNTGVATAMHSRSASIATTIRLHSHTEHALLSQTVPKPLMLHMGRQNIKAGCSRAQSKRTPCCKETAIDSSAYKADEQGTGQRGKLTFNTPDISKHFNATPAVCFVRGDVQQQQLSLLTQEQHCLQHQL